MTGIPRTAAFGNTAHEAQQAILRHQPVPANVQQVLAHSPYNTNQARSDAQRGVLTNRIWHKARRSTRHSPRAVERRTKEGKLKYDLRAWDDVGASHNAHEGLANKWLIGNGNVDQVAGVAVDFHGLVENLQPHLDRCVLSLFLLFSSSVLSKHL